MTASATGPQPSGRAIRHWKPTAEKSPAGYTEHPESSPGGAWVPFPLETAVIMAGPRGAAAPEPQGRRTGPALLSAAPSLSFGVGVERRADSSLRIPLICSHRTHATSVPCYLIVWHLSLRGHPSSFPRIQRTAGWGRVFRELWPVRCVLDFRQSEKYNL